MSNIMLVIRKSVKLSPFTVAGSAKGVKATRRRRRTRKALDCHANPDVRVSTLRDHLITSQLIAY